MEAPFSLRPATQADFPAIRRLVLAERINPTGLDWQRFLVAVNSDEELIGCGQVKSHRDGSRELASIVVVPAWRRRGVARAIIERLLAENPGTLYLTCRSSLGPLYEKFGFHALEPQDMPPYFRRLSRLASVMNLLVDFGETLLVMVR